MGGILHLPMRIEIPEDRAVDIELINRHTMETLTLEEVFAFSGICSNDRLDTYFTRMDPVSTLRNYAEDLKAGTSLLEGHDIRKNPYGRSYDGIMVAASGEPESFNSVRGFWYILRDTNANGAQTNDIIRQIKAGIIRDMSVGFGGSNMWYRCGSCGRDLFDWDCPHIPGLPDETGKTSFAWVVDANLREVSTVYKGSCPGAYVDKARAYIQQGQLSEKNVMLLERQFQVRLDDGKRSIYFTKKEGEQDVNLIQQVREALKENKLEKRALVEIIQGEGDPYRHPEDIALRNELGDLATVEAVKSLKEQAEQGRTYVADLIDQAVTARVKAQGEGFDGEKYRAMLTRTNDIEFIKGEITSYEDLAKQRFNSGRQTEGDDLGKGEPARTVETEQVEENIFD